MSLIISSLHVLQGFRHTQTMVLGPKQNGKTTFLYLSQNSRFRNVFDTKNGGKSKKFLVLEPFLGF